MRMHFIHSLWTRSVFKLKLGREYKTGCFLYERDPELYGFACLFVFLGLSIYRLSQISIK
jgi:hypothetical protein